MPVCRKCGRNAVTRVVSCNQCGLDFHEGCLARFIGTKSCNGCCAKTFKALSAPLVTASVPSRSERESLFDLGRDFGTSSLLDISDLSIASDNPGNTLSAAPVRLSDHRPEANSTMSKPPNWNAMSVDDKLGALHDLVTAGNATLNGKLDALTTKVDNHETRVVELENENARLVREVASLKERYDKGSKYAEIKVSGIPSTCQAPLTEITKSIFAKLNVANDLSDVRSVREIVSRPQSNVAEASQQRSQIGPRRVFLYSL